MKIYFGIGFVASIAAEDYFNILSVDGGGIRGLISAMVIQNMEEYAYEYMLQQKMDIPLHPDPENEKDVRRLVHMTDLFNMTAGTSTGSILAAGLATPMKDNASSPAYYSKELIDIYSTKGDLIFEKQSLSTGLAVFWFLVFVSVFGAVFYFCGKKRYDNPATIA